MGDGRRGLDLAIAHWSGPAGCSVLVLRPFSADAPLWQGPRGTLGGAPTFHAGADCNKRVVLSLKIPVRVSMPQSSHRVCVTARVCTIGGVLRELPATVFQRSSEFFAAALLFDVRHQVLGSVFQQPWLCVMLDRSPNPRHSRASAWTVRHFSPSHPLALHGPLRDTM